METLDCVYYFTSGSPDRADCLNLQTLLSALASGLLVFEKSVTLSNSHVERRANTSEALGTVGLSKDVNIVRTVARP